MRSLRITLFGLVTLLALPAIASANGSVDYDSTAHEVEYFGSGGADQVTISHPFISTSVAVSDATGLDANQGCTQSTATTAICTVATDATFDVRLGNGTDRFDPSGWAQSDNLTDGHVDAGGGTDTIDYFRSDNDSVFLGDRDLRAEDGRIALDLTELGTRLPTFEDANVTATAGPDLFDLSTWTHHAKVNGFGGGDELDASTDAATTTADDTKVTHPGGPTIDLLGFDGGTLRLSGGPSANRVDASAWTGEVELSGLAGDDVLIGGPGGGGLDGGDGTDECDGQPELFTVTGCESGSALPILAPPGNSPLPPPGAAPLPAANAQCGALRKQLKKAKKAHQQAKVRKLRRKLRRLGC